MGIEKNYNKEVNVERIADEESGDKQEYVLLEADVKCMIQPLDDSYTEDVDGNFGKDFIMFCGITDIKEFDRVIDGTTEYRVVGLEVFDIGNNPHMEVRIRTFNP